MPRSRRGVVVGNYCHDVLLRDGSVVAESLGGAASFISTVLPSSDCVYISKVGPDFKYSPISPPIVSPCSKTTVFHAHFSSDRPSAAHSDRLLKRVHACDPIRPGDLPPGRFEFGLAAGVAGEILPETLERLTEICDAVFVDVQGLIREFDEIDGSVRLIRVKDSGFHHLLPRIAFLKASSEEAEFLDLDEVRWWCCVLITNGESGCTVYCKDEEVQIPPFVTVQVDPTGAGDSFLAGFVAGLMQGLTVPDAALLGNLFGSLTVGHLGLPDFDSSLLQRIEEEVHIRKSQYADRDEEKEKLVLRKPFGHEQFHARLAAAKQAESPLSVHENGSWDRHNNNTYLCSEKEKLVPDPDEPFEAVNGKP